MSSRRIRQCHYRPCWIDSNCSWTPFSSWLATTTRIVPSRQWKRPRRRRRCGSSVCFHPVRMLFLFLVFLLLSSLLCVRQVTSCQINYPETQHFLSMTDPSVSWLSRGGGGGGVVFSPNGNNNDDMDDSDNDNDSDESNDMSSIQATEDQELDAYIENLIAGVDVDDNADDEKELLEHSNPNNEDDSDADSDSVGEDEEEEEKVRTVKVMATRKTQMTATKRKDDDTRKEIASPGEEEDEASAMPSVKATSSVYGQHDDEDRASPEEPRNKDGSDDDDDNNVSVSSSVPPTPPNAVYRFLLRQGRLGHIVVMVLVLLVEWVQLYIPPMAHLVSWLSTHVLGNDGTYGGHESYQAYLKAKRAQQRRSSASLLSGRTGQSKKKRRQQVKEADELALRQLRRIGSIQQAKYQYVTNAFLQRHKLGAFATDGELSAAWPRDGVDMQTEPEDDDDEEVEGSTATSTSKRRKRKSTKRKKSQEDQEVDWILEALTKGNRLLRDVASNKKSSSSSSSIKPTVSLEVGPEGPSVGVGVEFTIGSPSVSGKKETFREAIRVKPTTIKRRPRTSDKGGGDGVFGRLRAATGANSIVSRTVLGAYPGDAAPPTEAASSQGLYELAEKYGYGDWSDDDWEEDNGDFGDDEEGSTRKRKRRRRRTSSLLEPSSVASSSRKRRSSSSSGQKRRRSSSVSLAFDVTDLGKSGSFQTLRASRVRTNLGDAQRMPSLRTLDQSNRSFASPRGRSDRSTVRPAMDRLNELKRRRRKSKDNED